MVFSSFDFLLWFLPFCVIVYLLARKQSKNLVLLFFSIVFYAYGAMDIPAYLYLILISVVVNWIVGMLIGRQDKLKKVWLALGLCWDFGCLFVFKYADFFIGNLNRIPFVNLPLTNLVLPLGISFFTFQIASYLIDVYRNQVDVEYSLVDLGTYILMFPQLIAGPIVRFSDVQKELHHRQTRTDEFWQGVQLFIIGLGRKVLLANQLGNLWDDLANVGYESVSTPAAWMGIAAYSMQLYFDFSGYSQMAIGMGLMFGFHFDENFRHPFLCKDISEFWQRWHISLGTFFRDYLLYIPIFGKRRKYGGLFLVWFCTGFWHGASWNFIIWGLYFGVFIFIEQLIGKKKIAKIPLVIRHIYSKLVILVGFGIFYFEDLGKLLSYFRDLFGLNQNRLVDELTTLSVQNNLFLLIAAVICCFPLIDGLKKLSKQYRSAGWITESLRVVCNAGLLAVSSIMLVDATNNPFLYFRF